jgi:glycosyltransferase involved in cell wall biosynthesis
MTCERRSPNAMRSSVSVIIPTYNRSRLVTRAVRSVLREIEPDDEVIVVDDGSTDDTVSAMAEFRPRVRYMVLPNGGPGAARNHGIAAATRPLVAFLDSDDEWLPGKLRLQRTLMDAMPELVFTFTKFDVHDDESGQDFDDGLAGMWLDAPRPWREVLGDPRRYSEVAPIDGDGRDFDVHVGDLYAPLLERMYVAASTAMVRAAAAGDAFRFAEDLRICEDWYCFARMARCGPVGYLDRATVLNHGHAGLRLTGEQGQLGLITARIAITERLWGRDAAFLAAHADRYRRVLANQYTSRARWLISHGRTAEARSDLRHAGRSPQSLRLLSLLPGQLAHGLGAARRTLLRLRGA